MNLDFTSSSRNHPHYSRLIFNLSELNHEDRHARLDAVLPSTARTYPRPFGMDKEEYWVIFLYNIQFYGWRKATENSENPPYPRDYLDNPWWNVKKVDGLWTATFDHNYHIIRELSRQKKKVLKYVFLTISHCSKLDTILKYHKSMNNKKMMKLSTYWYSIEQRGETLADLGKGLHSHIIIRVLPKFIKNGNYQKGRLIKETANTFKVEKNFIDVKFLYTEADFSRTLNYIQGEKKDEDKHAKVEMDVIFRQKNNLCLLYTNAS